MPSTNKAALYKKLVRLREKRARLQRHISLLEQKLKGEKFRWGGCSGKGNRT